MTVMIKMTAMMSMIVVIVFGVLMVLGSEKFWATCTAAAALTMWGSKFFSFPMLLLLLDCTVVAVWHSMVLTCVFVSVGFLAQTNAAVPAT